MGSSGGGRPACAQFLPSERQGTLIHSPPGADSSSMLSQKTERPKSTGKDGRSSHETAAWDVVHLLLYYVDYRGTVLPNPVVAAVSEISLGHLPLSLVSSFVMSGPSSTDQSAGTAVCVLV